jgi:hypothetical protein
MDAKLLGLICIALSLVFLLGSFFSPAIQVLDASVPLAGISIIFVILSLLFFQQAERSVMKTQWMLNSEFAKEIHKASSAIDAEEKSEKKDSGELKKDISSLAADMKRQDKALSIDIRKQGKTLSSDVKRQAKAGKDLKKRVDTLATDVKKMKGPAKASVKKHKPKRGIKTKENWAKEIK